ncbi:MAG: stage V sporulation protein T [Bacillota bacterium]
MKATGIVRRIDDLGRVVIPKEIRRTMRIGEGEPLEIFVDRDGEVILKKYSPLGQLNEFAEEYVESLHEVTGYIACVLDKDVVVAVAGASDKKFLDKSISPAVEKVMNDQKTVVMKGDEVKPFCADYRAEDVGKFSAQVMAPIISKEGKSLGAVVLSTTDSQESMGQLEEKLAQTAAGFLAQQMEE